MKIIRCSLCIGSLLLGASACGNSANPSSGTKGSAAGAPDMSVDGTSGATQTVVGGKSGTDLVVPPPGGAGGSDGTCTGSTCTCAPGNTTTIEGFVYDPAGKNPLYNISVYVADPSSPLPDLDQVPLACGCEQLLPKKVLAMGNPTDATGHFVIPCAPSGTVSLVVQTGKWRMKYDGITVTPNQANMAPKLRLPANSAEGSLPNIAIATGASDSFECLPMRIGVSKSEYVGGSTPGGHIHIYSGYRGAKTAQGTVDANQGLWDSQAHFNEHDVVLLSCEGQETTGGNPGAAVGATEQGYLMNYANAGGRVFASHFQYSWLNTGPFATGANNIATWSPGPQHLDDTVALMADIDTTLPSGAAFPEGVALAQWLKLVGALTGNQLPVWFTRNNVQALNAPPSTEWIRLDANAPNAPLAPQYFSVDTPMNAAGGELCGRVVYSDLHVSGGPGTNAPGIPADYPTQGMGMGMGMGGQMRGGVVPDECADHPLTPQEAALEFMLFDLSSCLVPIGQSPVIPK
ncbi:MAG: hypothetical protein ABUL62_33540 [Myxococcales bacterium]